MSASLAKKFPSLADVKATNPNSLSPLKGFVYSDNCLGSGSFGKVLLGWTKDGKKEVAVKVIERSFLKKEPKLKENLEREIRILKLMSQSDCDYVVKILDYQETKKTFLLVMEKCDYDLDHLIGRSPLSEDQVITFLYQLAEGMKALRRQNIVHRDLKPGNILIRENPASKEMMFKLADFGFARRFKDDADRNINMQSLAGTPVYMAPEALQCVFTEGRVYDDKVDIWSIGALLYKVIVGDCGFYAGLKLILDHLQRKGDAIAFELLAGKVNYIYELPSSVNVRLSEPFREQMNKLLQHMLKVDPRERMPFPVFFDFVDDIITSKIEVISLLHGTSFKIVSDSRVRADTLVKMVCEKWKTPLDDQIIFSPKCSHYISCKALTDPTHSDPTTLSDSAFEDLLYMSGGSYGHAKLYVLDTNHQQGELVPDLSSLDPLKFALENGQIARLVMEAKFSDEIVYMMDCLRLQLIAQLEGLEKLAQFTVQEISLSKDYFKLLENVHQTLARVSLMMEWLREEEVSCGSVSQHCLELLKQLTEKKEQLQDLSEQLGIRSIPTITGSFNLREFKKLLSAYKDAAKRLRRIPKEAIPVKCRELYEKCDKIITRATFETRTQLLPFAEAWATRRAHYDRSVKVLDVADLFREVEEERAKMMYAKISPSGGGEVGPAPNPPSPMSAKSSVEDSALFQQLTHLKTQLSTERARSRELGEELARRQRAKELEIKVEEEEGSTPVEERTIVSPIAKSPEDVLEMADLSQQLKLFCSEAQRIILPVPGANFFPDLSNGSSSKEEFDMRQMLVMSQELANTLKANLPSLRELLRPKQADTSDLVLRIGQPSEYRKGDVAVFVPFKMNRGFTVPSILHLKGSRPSMLMDVRSYGAFGVGPGRVPDLLFAQLTETPRQMKLENHKQVAEDIGEKTGYFYRMNAKPVDLQLRGKCPLLLPTLK